MARVSYPELIARKVLATKLVIFPEQGSLLKKLRRLLSRKPHFRIEVWVRLSALRLFHVGHFVQNKPMILSLVWHEWFSFSGKEWNINYCELALPSEHIKICRRHLADMSKICTKKRAARAARLIFLIQPVKSLNCGVFVAVAVVISQTPHKSNLARKSPNFRQNWRFPFANWLIRPASSDKWEFAPGERLLKRRLCITVTTS